MPSPLLTVAALFSGTLRAVKEQQYQREHAWVVDHSKYARAFGADVTSHGEAIRLTLAWWQADGHTAAPRSSTGADSRSI